MIEIIEATDNTFEQEVKRSTLPVIVFFYSKNCGYCRNEIPLYKELFLKYKEKVRFVTVNTNENPIKSSEYKINSIPTFLLVKNRKTINTITGFLHKYQLEDLIKSFS
ncbi:MAG: thioredoxin domain-containing protein [bacterium]